MALEAMTTADAVKYVSDLDPAKKYVDAPVDPDQPDGPKKKVEQIDEAAATFFELRPLDVFLQGWIYDNASSMRGEQGKPGVDLVTKVNQTNLDMVRFSLAGWSNFKSKGNAIAFKSKTDFVNGREYTVADDESIRLLGIKLVAELATKIRQISEVSAFEAKN